MMTEKNIILAARTISMIFTPFYLPFLGMTVLFTFSYLNNLSLTYIITVLLMVYLSTILLPTLLIRLFHHYQGWAPLEKSIKERRMVPYIISILCYFMCYYLMAVLQMPSFMGRIIMAALLVQIVCSIVNIWWKVSTHTAGIGGVTGALMAFSFLFDFNPLWWLCLCFAVAGLVATSRIILRQHTLAQVVGGFWIGLFTAFIIII
jgi:membrane-associated phospholipid phosphatase